MVIMFTWNRELWDHCTKSLYRWNAVAAMVGLHIIGVSGMVAALLLGAIAYAGEIAFLYAPLAGAAVIELWKLRRMARRVADNRYERQVAFGDEVTVECDADGVREARAEHQIWVRRSAIRRWIVRKDCVAVCSRTAVVMIPLAPLTPREREELLTWAPPRAAHRC